MSIDRQMERSGGFTLIELLVVIFIIGLISGFAVLSVNSRGDEREIENQLKLLQYLLTMAGEESVIQGRPVGVHFEEGKYSFLIAGKNKWIELDDGRIFKPRELLRDWRFKLLLGSEGLGLAKTGEDSSQFALVPQIIFHSSGEIDYFELLVLDENHAPRYRIWFGDDGVIGLKAVDES